MRDASVGGAWHALAGSGGELLVAELFVRPGAAVVGEHVHQIIDERFPVLEGGSACGWTGGSP